MTYSLAGTGQTLLLMVLGLPLGPFALAGQSVVPSMVGVWESVSIDSVGPKVRTGPTPPIVGPTGPGLMIVSATHYAQVSVATPAARPQLPDSNYTIADLLATWGPFGASAGTYRIRGDTLFIRPSVDKNPRMMVNFRWRYRFRILGDTLWLTNVAEQVTRRLRRVE